MLVDSHVHLDFYDDPTPILARARDAGLSQILAIGIGDGPATMHRALAFAQANRDVFASAGIHPQEAHQASSEALRTLAILGADPRCIAIGEIGLDYYHLKNPEIHIQKTAFLAQLELAAALGKPVLIHCRTSELATPEAQARFEHANAFDDTVSLLERHWSPTGLSGIMHCFSGTPEQSKRALAAGLYLSFAGNLTYSKSTSIQQAAIDAPDDRILIETDSPFLAPVPYRGKPNEPALITHTAAFLAELRGITPYDLATLTTANFHRLFPSTAAPNH